MRIIRQRTTDERRSAFTLIEMLIVLTIILILIGLLAAGVMRVMVKGPELQVQSEFSGFATSIGAFKQEFNVAYIPSRLLLCEDGNYSIYAGTPFQQLANDSLTYLQQVFGSRALLSNSQTGFVPIDWNGDGNQYISTKSAPMILEGQHCLVFFLGGMQGGPLTVPAQGSNNCLGFATDPVQPYSVAGNRRGGGPFFDFKSSRLVTDSRPIPGSSPATPLNFFVYLDPFNKASPINGQTNGPLDPLWTNTYVKQPYAFFSSYRTANGYNRYGSSDCPSLQYQQNGSTNVPPALQPYFIPGTTNFLNASSYQIISAGPDGVFGVPSIGPTSVVGGAWQGAAGQGTAGLDDWGYFSRVVLGAPQSN